MLLGVFLFDDLTQYNQYLGPIFFWSFVMLVYFAVLAAFIAFILDAFTKAKRKAEAEYDYLKNMLSARLRDQWSFARNRVSKSMAHTQTQRMQVDAPAHARVRDAYRKDLKPPVGAPRGGDVTTSRTGAPRARPGSAIAREERLQRASFLELRDRHAATQSLLKRIREQRESVVEMVKQAQTQQARQQRQLEELGTQLWNAYRLVDTVDGRHR